MVIRMLIVYREFTHLNVRRYHVGSWSVHMVCIVKLRLRMTAYCTKKLPTPPNWLQIMNSRPVNFHYFKWRDDSTRSEENKFSECLAPN